MKVLEILVEKDDGEIEVRTEFSAKEIQHLLQFAVNMSATVGLNAYNKAVEEADMQQELND
jgi:hypothetical protein